MDIRKFIFDWFRQTTPIEEFQQIFHEASSIELPNTKPFGLYRFGTLRPLTSGDDNHTTWVQAVYIQVHDLPGDYGNQIDPWLVDWTMALGITPIPPDLIQEHPYIVRVELDYLSEDFRNPDWDTIFRTLRLYVYGRNPNTMT